MTISEILTFSIAVAVIVAGARADDIDLAPCLPPSAGLENVSASSAPDWLPEPVSWTTASDESHGVSCAQQYSANQNCAPTIRMGLPVWLPEVHGATTIRGVEAPVNITTRDLFRSVDDIDFVVAGRLETEMGRWGVLVDGLYLNLAFDRGIQDRIDLTAGFEQALVDSLVTYDVGRFFATDEFNGWDTELLVGARYVLLETDGITVTGPRGRSVTRSGRRDWVDPIIGGRFTASLTRDATLIFRGDVGGFDWGTASRLTWNIEALCEWRCSPCCALQLGYRLLDIDYRRGSGSDRFTYDVQYRGPLALLVLDF